MLEDSKIVLLNLVSMETMRKSRRAILWNSRSAKLLGIRKVTQDNQGRKTAGVDGLEKVKRSRENI
jgi:RNA-directed DNA polymerase